MAQHMDNHDDRLVGDIPSILSDDQRTAYRLACRHAHSIPAGIRMVIWAFHGSIMALFLPQEFSLM